MLVSSVMDCGMPPLVQSSTRWDRCFCEKATPTLLEEVNHCCSSTTSAKINASSFHLESKPVSSREKLRSRRGEMLEFNEMTSASFSFSVPPSQNARLQAKHKAGWRVSRSSLIPLVPHATLGLNGAVTLSRTKMNNLRTHTAV